MTIIYIYMRLVTLCSFTFSYQDHQRSLLGLGIVLKFYCVLYFVQAAVLLLFNTTERLSYTDIKGQLNLTDEDVIRLLHSLSCAKYKILNKEPNSKSVTQTDYFEFNIKFTDKMRRIKVCFLLTSLPLNFWGLKIETVVVMLSFFFGKIWGFVCNHLRHEEPFKCIVIAVFLLTDFG
jgi:hypothetical protein